MIVTGERLSHCVDAALAAISSPLLDFPVKAARGVVFNCVGGTDLSLSEIQAAADVIYENVDPDANIIFGAMIDERMSSEVSITVLREALAILGREGLVSVSRNQVTVH